MSASGACPALDFLEDLRRSDPGDHRPVVAGVAKLRDRQNHHEPLSKFLGNGLYELRHVGKLNTRILWFYRKGQRIILLHGIRNKGQKVAPSDPSTATERMADWNRRHAP